MAARRGYRILDRNVLAGHAAKNESMDGRHSDQKKKAEINPRKGCSISPASHAE